MVNRQGNYIDVAELLLNNEIYPNKKAIRRSYDLNIIKTGSELDELLKLHGFSQ